jgi:hypothetical protein
VQTQAKIPRQQEVDGVLDAIGVGSLKHLKPVVRGHQGPHLPEIIGSAGFGHMALEAGLELGVIELHGGHRFSSQLEICHEIPLLPVPCDAKTYGFEPLPELELSKRIHANCTGEKSETEQIA